MSTPPTLEDVYGTDKPSLVHTHPGEHHNDYENSTSLQITRATKIYALCAAINSCNLGYDIGVNTNAGWRVQQDFGLSNAVRKTCCIVERILSCCWCSSSCFDTPHSHTQTHTHRRPRPLSPPPLPPYSNESCLLAPLIFGACLVLWGRIGFAIVMVDA